MQRFFHRFISVQCIAVACLLLLGGCNQFDPDDIDKRVLMYDNESGHPVEIKCILYTNVKTLQQTEFSLKVYPGHREMATAVAGFDYFSEFTITFDDGKKLVYNEDYSIGSPLLMESYTNITSLLKEELDEIARQDGSSSFDGDVMPTYMYTITEEHYRKAQ